MPRPPIPTWYFALVVVRRGDRFLLVQESTRGNLWYLPAGRVEPGESLRQAALRETLEESGIAVELESIVRIQHTTYPEGTARLRVIFTARPVDETAPKSVADAESLQAAWMSLEEVERIPLRSQEVLDLFRYVERGGPLAPLDLLQFDEVMTSL